jgi:hypothetical protein
MRSSALEAWPSKGPFIGAFHLPSRAKALRRLNGDETATTKAARTARSALINAMIPLIRGLHWKDFELLVELVMTQGGWRRMSATGGTQKTIDLELELPFTGERALVQIKSELSQSEVMKVTKELTERCRNKARLQLR